MSTFNNQIFCVFVVTSFHLDNFLYIYFTNEIKISQYHFFSILMRHIHVLCRIDTYLIIDECYLSSEWILTNAKKMLNLNFKLY